MRTDALCAPVPPPPANVDLIPDAVPKFEPRSPHGNPPFYDVLGRRYFVLGKADGYLERGVASLACHQAYLEHVGQDAREMVTGNARAAGAQCGVDYATTFEVLAP